MQPELRILGQQPVKASLAGIEIAIYPPTIYRLQEIIDAVNEVRKTMGVFDSKKMKGLLRGEDSSDETEAEFLGMLKSFVTEFVGKTSVALQLMCTSPTGEVPEELTRDEFWHKDVTTSGIANLVEVFVELVDLDRLLKKVGPLVGLALNSSRGRLS